VPTVLRGDGFRVVIFLPPREHGPAHVPVRKAGGEIIIELDPVSVVEHNMTRVDGRAAVRLVAANVSRLLEDWGRIHG
jgi:hypothetical protein